MTAAMSNSPEILGALRYRARARRMRPVVWAMIWASLAHVSWLAFKLAQVRLQPDAIATGLPGFLFRLVIRPLQIVVDAVGGGDPALLTLQTGMMMAICVAAIGVPLHIAFALGGERRGLVLRTAQAVPGRRETTWK